MAILAVRRRLPCRAGCRPLRAVSRGRPADRIVGCADGFRGGLPGPWRRARRSDTRGRGGSPTRPGCRAKRGGALGRGLTRAWRVRRARRGGRRPPLKPVQKSSRRDLRVESFEPSRGTAEREQESPPAARARAVDPEPGPWLAAQHGSFSATTGHWHTPWPLVERASSLRLSLGTDATPTGRLCWCARSGGTGDLGGHRLPTCRTCKVTSRSPLERLVGIRYAEHPACPHGHSAAELVHTTAGVSSAYQNLQT
ncbi:hypothetical protein FraEuI1c_3539 [Pseudofrankia inefficax]|uniref:Uncharacterized protein n=1 Tax=Pseudofrankia inefficax (strain DSM 45817 / CECT 9037 / DDB 130130 / EuI1c) TaxID=298654 RepID=E3IZB9_PSEI1|nr:hypothetical protein FraEuI1c_3539 [Pseudofrankia inefficax]